MSYQATKYIFLSEISQSEKLHTLEFQLFDTLEKIALWQQQLLEAQEKRGDKNR